MVCTLMISACSAIAFVQVIALSVSTLAIFSIMHFLGKLTPFVTLGAKVVALERFKCVTLEFLCKFFYFLYFPSIYGGG